jgi:hypothetical protein
MDSSKKIFLPLTRDEKQMLVAQGVAGAAYVGGVALLATQPAHAQSAPGISDMQNGVTAIQGLVTTTIPIAVGVLVFSAGALVIKRLLFA